MQLKAQNPRGQEDLGLCQGWATWTQGPESGGSYDRDVAPHGSCPAYGSVDKEISYQRRGASQTWVGGHGSVLHAALQMRVGAGIFSSQEAG